MPSRLDLCAPCDWKGVVALLKKANDFLCANALPPGQAYAVSLVLEELVTNVVRHAYDDPSGHDLCLDLALDAGKVRIVSRDHGRPFDPTAAKPQEPPASLAEATPGGLGLTLIRNMSESVAYSRRDGRNVVEVVVGEPDWERLGGNNRN